MQFHLNGFRPGNPEVLDTTPQLVPRTDTLPEEVDVLIVGWPRGLDPGRTVGGVSAHPHLYR